MIICTRSGVTSTECSDASVESAGRARGAAHFAARRASDLRKYLVLSLVTDPGSSPVSPIVASLAECKVYRLPAQVGECGAKVWESGVYRIWASEDAVLMRVSRTRPFSISA